MSDYIRLPRSALCDIWRDPDLGRLLLYLMSRADCNGEAVINSGEICRELGYPRQRFRTLLGKLVSNHLLTTSPTTNATTIKFDTQQVKPKRQPPKQPPKQPPANHLPEVVKPKKFVPPTEEEVRDYVREKGYHFNPEQFVPHYESKGWRVGKEPMKDWRAACRTWEATWKEKHGNRFYFEIAVGATPQAAASGRGQHRNPTAYDIACDILGKSSN